VCHNPVSGIFFIDLRLAARERTIAGPFIHTDSIVTLHDSTTVTRTLPKSFWDDVLSDAEVIGGFVLGFVIGKVIP
jgi:hypothetical protein